MVQSGFFYNLLYFFFFPFSNLAAH